MKFTPLTKEIKPKKQKKVQSYKKALTPTNYIIPKIKEFPNSIMGLINSLPSTISSILTNGNLTRIKVNSTSLLAIIDNRFTVKVKDLKIGKDSYYYVNIKDNNKVVFNRHIKS